MSELWKTPLVVPAVCYTDVPRAAQWLEQAFGFREREGSRLVGDGWTLTWMEVGGGGLILAYGVLAALLEASNSGKGQVVDARFARF